MKIILLGASGMVGAGSLREALKAPGVDSVLSVGRRPCGVVHPKLRELLLPDLFDFSAVEDQLTGYDACIWGGRCRSATPAALVIVVAAPLIWPWRTAFLLSLVGSMSASVVGFSFARFLAREWVSARIPVRLRRYDDLLERNGVTVASLFIAVLARAWERCRRLARALHEVPRST